MRLGVVHVQVVVPSLLSKLWARSDRLDHGGLEGQLKGETLHLLPMLY